MSTIDPSKAIVCPAYLLANAAWLASQSSPTRIAARALLFSGVSVATAWGSAGAVSSGVVGAVSDGVVSGSSLLLSSAQDRATVRVGLPGTVVPAAGFCSQTSQFDSRTTPNKPPPSTLTSPSNPASLMALFASASVLPVTSGMVVALPPPQPASPAVATTATTAT